MADKHKKPTVADKAREEEVQHLLKEAIAVVRGEAGRSSGSFEQILRELYEAASKKLRSGNTVEFEKMLDEFKNVLVLLKGVQEELEQERRRVEKLEQDHLDREGRVKAEMEANYQKSRLEKEEWEASQKQKQNQEEAERLRKMEMELRRVQEELLALQAEYEHAVEEFTVVLASGMKHAGIGLHMKPEEFFGAIFNTDTDELLKKLAPHGSALVKAIKKDIEDYGFRGKLRAVMMLNAAKAQDKQVTPDDVPVSNDMSVSKLREAVDAQMAQIMSITVPVPAPVPAPAAPTPTLAPVPKVNRANESVANAQQFFAQAERLYQTVVKTRVRRDQRAEEAQKVVAEAKQQLGAMPAGMTQVATRLTQGIISANASHSLDVILRSVGSRISASSGLFANPAKFSQSDQSSVEAVDETASQASGFGKGSDKQ